MKINETFMEALEGFYEPIEDSRQANAYSRGQLVMAYPVYPLVSERIFGLKIEEDAGEDVNFNEHSFSIQRVKHPRHFDELIRRRPIKDLQLGHNEYLLVMKAKKRPAIFWNKVIVRWKDGTTADYCILIPMFGLDKENQDCILKTSCFEYNEWFYMPVCNDFTTKEGAAHFDKTQVFPMKYIHPFSGNLKPSPGVQLNEIAMWLFCEHWCDYWGFDNPCRELRDEISTVILNKVGSN